MLANSVVSLFSFLPVTVFIHLVSATTDGGFCTLLASSKAVKQSVKAHILNLAGISAASKE